MTSVASVPKSSNSSRHKALHNKTDQFIETVIVDLQNSFTGLSFKLASLGEAAGDLGPVIEEKIARLEGYIDMLTIYHKTLKGLRKINSKEVYLAIVTNITDYEKPIMEKSEAFFMDEEVFRREMGAIDEKYELGMSEKDKEEGLLQAMHFRELWQGYLTTAVKPKLWKELGTLLKLSKKYQG